MTSFIDSIKSKLIMAVDCEQKQIINKNSLLEAYNQLESFPMTLALLNKSRIGKTVNEIRHWDDVETDIKKKLKGLIKKWNGCLSASNSNTLSNGLNSTRNSHNNLSIKSASNPNIFEINGNRENHPKKRPVEPIIERLDVETPYKVRKINRKESPILRTNIDENSTDSLLSDTKSVSRDDSKNNHRRNSRKDLSNINGIVNPLPKVKSTKELLAGFGDFIGSDTRKRILCDEILPEDDIPKSCLPESVRPRSKLLKTTKSTSQINDIIKPNKNSPRLQSLNVEEKNPGDIVKIDVTATKICDINSKVTCETVVINNLPKTENKSRSNKRNRSNNFNNNISSSHHQINNHLQYNKEPLSTIEEDPLKIKIKHHKRKSHKKKHKHSIDPPITNYMNDIFNLPDISNVIFEFVEESAEEPSQNASEVNKLSTEEAAEKLAHSLWIDHNCNYNSDKTSINSYTSCYYQSDLIVLPWTDTVYQSNSFFTDAYDQSFDYIISQITLPS